MEEEKLGRLLNELAERTAEPVRGGLAGDIKGRIPHRLVPHRMGMDTINIIIDLRIGKLAAAAVIIVTMILLANFFSGRYSAGEGIYQDSKLLIRYCLSGAGVDKSSVLAETSKLYEYLVSQGEDVVYYGDSIDLEDSNAVLMQWKLSDDEYRVVFGDLRARTVSAEELIRLQGRMLQKKSGR